MDSGSVLADVDGVGLMNVDDDQYIAIVRIGKVLISSVVDENRRSLRRFFQPFLSGLEFDTEGVEMLASVTVPTLLTTESAGSSGAHDADPITVALSVCREALVGATSEMSTDHEY